MTFNIDDRIAQARKIGKCSKCGKPFDGTVPEALSLSSSKMCSDCEFKDCEAEFQKGFKEELTVNKKVNKGKQR